MMMKVQFLNIVPKVTNVFTVIQITKYIITKLTLVKNVLTGSWTGKWWRWAL